MKRKILLLLFLFNYGSAAYSGGREYAVTQVVPAAGALSLGNAYAAHEADAVSFCWNPASLAFAQRIELSTLQSHLTTDADFFVLSGALPLPKINLGFSWAQLQMSGIPETAAELDNNEVISGGLLTYAENSALISLAGKLNAVLGWGVSFRYLNQQVWTASGSGWSTAVGLFWRLPRVNFGLAVENLSSYQKYDTGYVEHLPPTYLLGVNWRLGTKFALAQDWRWRADGRRVQSYTGAEFYPFQRVRFALGYLAERWTAGAGLAVGAVRLDYAYAAQNDSALGSDQYVSLGVQW
ncbi:hypothetical protein NO2_0945 [Candidatus Termititenax persephonae]|uniref:Outer membrane protein n=1 Tax=Candidatus Termititenax persephonae TaxID=2218525 RepID=A0A388THQ0_9BACT|nr:hypothetical protein NO2_0945 [Candidatus Termititenax persephonae]